MGNSYNFYFSTLFFKKNVVHKIFVAFEVALHRILENINLQRDIHTNPFHIFQERCGETVNKTRGQASVQHSLNDTYPELIIKFQ